jgi:hypothetical protein
MNPTPAIPTYANHPLLTSPFGVCQSQKEITFPPSASAAEILVTPTPIVPPAPRRRVRRHTRKLSTNNSPVAPPLTLNTVSISTSTATGSEPAPDGLTEEAKFTHAPYVDPKTTALVAESVWTADPDSIPYSTWDTDPISLSPPSRHVFLNNLRIIPSAYDSDSDFSKIITPYCADQLELFLRNANLLDQYPQLPDKIRHGFPLGELDPIETTYAPPNLPSALEHDQLIQDYINTELSLGRFSGPFTQEELEIKIGPFRSSPLQVAVKEEAPGQPKKFRVCRNLSFKGPSGRSVNDEIDAKDFPTRWGTAQLVADFVSLPLLFTPAFLFPLPYLAYDLAVTNR